MFFMNIDTKSDSVKTPEKCLQEAEQAEKNVPGGMPPGMSTFFSVCHLH